MENAIVNQDNGVFTEIGKKRGRKEDLRSRSSSGSRLPLGFYGYIIGDNFEWRITKLQIKFDKFVNTHARGKLMVTLKRSPSTRMSISPF